MAGDANIVCLDWDNAAEDTTFRVVTDKAWRKGIRLENSNWNFLRQLARASNLRTGQYIHNVLSQNADEANATSFLRLHVLNALNSRIETLAAQASPARLYNVLRHCGAPYFAINEARQLTSYSAEFERYVGEHLADRKAGNRDQSPAAMSSVRLALAIPIDQIVDTLKNRPGEVLDCGFTIVADGTRHAGRTRVCLFEGIDGAIIVSYVVT